ncbi:unnamed protein product [Nesidiocoris tenuis]|uniref:Uncharacterized protein n=1 Tax=Nesidiocoris tenuis TaxID=355587 RepID=A0A6H5HGA0_9HEMI|nr:unnamed protein product [Nesidiocoris tenuis]
MAATTTITSTATITTTTTTGPNSFSCIWPTVFCKAGSCSQNWVYYTYSMAPAHDLILRMSSTPRVLFSVETMRSPSRKSSAIRKQLGIIMLAPSSLITAHFTEGGNKIVNSRIDKVKRDSPVESRAASSCCQVPGIQGHHCPGQSVSVNSEIPRRSLFRNTKRFLESSKKMLFLIPLDNMIELPIHARYRGKTHFPNTLPRRDVDKQGRNRRNWPNPSGKVKGDSEMIQ